MRTIDIAYRKIRNGNTGAGTAFFFAAVLSLAVFAGQFLSQSLSKGAQNLKDRLGADIAVVPRGQEGRYQDILLNGEPISCTLDRGLEEEIRAIEGVDKVTPVIYLASLNASCCSVPIQIIGYEPETDFVIAPWISEQFTTRYKGGELVLGYNVAVDDGNTLKLFGRSYQVGARLHKTGTGMDRSVYVTFDEMEQIMHDAQDKGIRFEVDSLAGNPELANLSGTGNRLTDRYVSAFLIQLKEGADPDSVARHIRRDTSAGVVQRKDVLATVSDGMAFFSKLILWITVGMMILVIAVTIVLHVFRVNVRRKEWAVFLMLGADKGFLLRLILTETLLLSLGGAVAGTSLGALFAFSFRELIAEQIGLPFYATDWWSVSLEIFVSFALTVVSGCIPGMLAGFLAARTDCYELMREGER